MTFQSLNSESSMLLCCALVKMSLSLVTPVENRNVGDAEGVVVPRAES